MLIVWAAVCLVAVFSVTAPRGYSLTFLGDLTQCLLLVSALIACVVNVRVSERPARFFWVLIALGFGLWLSAQMLWTYFEVFLRREVPNPFIGDVILFLHLVPLMGALAMQLHTQRGERNARLGVVDFVLLVVWWLYLYLFVVIPWQYVLFNEALYGRNFDLAYFIEHMVLLLITGVLWVRTSGDWRVIYGHLFGASVLYALGSVTAGIAIDSGRYYTGSLYDVPLVAAMAWFTGIALAARRLTLATDFPKDSSPKKRGGWMTWMAMVTILSLPVLAGWALFGSRAPGEIRSFRVLLTLATMMIMGVLLALKQYRLDKELDCANQELREASLTDLLTGTRNRRFLSTTIETDVRHVIRSFSPNAGPQRKPNRDLVFYFIDIDHFKEVNDQYGHEAGDQVLVEVARRISSAIRHSDALIRWGGEEFLVVSRYTNRHEAHVLAARVLKAVGNEPFEFLDGRSMRRTCSLGWAAFPWFVSAPESLHYEEVLRLADSALYQAKNAGRNQAIGMLPASEKPTSATVRNSADKNPTEALEVRTIATLGPSTPSQNASGEMAASSAAGAAAGS
jgi:diguanylate cyclase (GGDEF)-like protein